ncbi:MAG: XRE family transcriptional regulator [Deltaproteobacteria bacterium]|nr:XRE family transcriptional regulator [Deltaproteobacteria bacterium]
MILNPSRLVVARKRRGLSRVGLAKASGLAVRSLTYYESAKVQPSEPAVRALAQALDFPEKFFYGPDIEEPSSSGSNFRALSTMTARQRDAALAVGAIAIEFSKWMDRRFELPKPTVPDLYGFRDAEAAARAVRAQWGLGERPINNVVHLLEAHGVRVFSLPIDSSNVDAFSVWHQGVPFVFLNQSKSAERLRMDVCHELGHLALHKKQGRPGRRQAELEANRFASAFLVPADDLLACVPRGLFLTTVHRMKVRWGISAIGLVHRLRALDLLTEWQYRTLCIEISKEGGRRTERDGTIRDNSQVLTKVLGMLRDDGITQGTIADDLSLNPSELEGLLHGLTITSIGGGRHGSKTQAPSKTHLRIV